MNLPAIYRKAARLADDLNGTAAVFTVLGAPQEIQHEELLWYSFSGHRLVPAGNESVLGLLLLAEILETAE